MQQISVFGSSAMSVLGHVLPLLLLAVILGAIVARRLRMNLRLPPIGMPQRRPARRKRGPALRLVKGAAMDQQLAELLRDERQRDGRS